MEEKAEWRGLSENQIGGEEKWQTRWCWQNQQRTCRMTQSSAEKLEHAGPAKKKGVASVPQREQLDRAVPQGEKQLVLLSFGEERIEGA